MEDEVKELKLEIEVLKKRLSHLEGIENRRKIFKIIKITIGVIVIIALALLIYSFYQQINEFNNSITEFYNNPLKVFK